MFLTSYKILLAMVLSVTLCLPDASARLQKLPLADSSTLEQNFQDKLVKKERLNVDIEDPVNLAAHEQVMLRQDDMHNKSTVSELIRRSLQVRIYHSVYNDLLLQRYDSFSELRNSGGPNVNQEVCLNQLRHLNKRLDVQVDEKYNSNDINLAQLLNTFGRASSSLHLGDGFWPGAYEECLRLRIETPEGQVPSRYCVAHVTHKSTTENKTPLEMVTAMKSGVCLPKSCDSLDYKNKYKLILRLMDSNMREIDRNQGDLTELYCLPDSQSPQRTWWLQPASVISILCLLIWIAVLVYVTLKKDPESEIYKSLSITRSLQILLRTSDSDTENPEQVRSNEEQAETPMKTGGAVDLSIVDGIKVVSMSYIIAGHVLMTIAHNLDNYCESGRTSSIVYRLSNMAPAFAVNAFFGITGLLTSYQMLRQNISFSFMKSPIKFGAYALHRYLRIMPIYVVVVVYAKYLAKYAGSGPFWDYGTTALGHRRTCEEESWLWTFLFGANFKSPLRHCNSTAWYLANDFHFFLVTPIFLILLRRRPSVGKLFLLAVMITSYIASIKSGVDVKELDDFRASALYHPHGFRAFISNLYLSYTRPYYRIPSYLCGLLAGYFLYALECRRRKFAADNEKQDKETAESKSGSEQMEPDWPVRFQRLAPIMSALFLLLCTTTPITSSLRPIEKNTARYKVSIAVPTFNLLFSLAVTSYCLVSSTGHGFQRLNRFLSAPFWKPLARLSLCALLVNVELILYLSQVKTHVIHLESITHFSIIVVSLVGTYLISALLFVLFEAPLRSGLRALLSGKSLSDNKKVV